MLTPFGDFLGRAAYYVGDADPRVSRLRRLLLRPGDVAGETIRVPVRRLADALEGPELTSIRP